MSTLALPHHGTAPSRTKLGITVVLVTGLLALAGRTSADDELVVSDPAEGSVAPYVPTVEEDVELMLDVAGVRPGDYVIDLGSGDGRIAIAAAGRGAFAHGVEIEPELVEAARRNAIDAGVADRVSFVVGDIFAAHIADASVVTLYLFPEANITLRPKLLAELAPGTRVVSNSFDMGDWRPDVHDTSARSSGGILLWIVPANVGGEWTVDVGGAVVAEADGAARGPGAEAERSTAGGRASAASGGAGRADSSTAERYSLSVVQAYQDIDVAFTPLDADPSAERMDVGDVTLRGDRIAFRVTTDGGSQAFAGRVTGSSMSGYVTIREDDGTRLRRWHAERVR